MSLGIYFTLGDLGLRASEAILIAAAQAGATLLEIGVGFSDPLLDGSTIQASHVRALESQLSWEDVCAALVRIRSQIPGTTQISLMLSYQLLYSAERGAKLPPLDGILLPDISYRLPSPVLLPSPRVWFLSPDLVFSPTFGAAPETISMVYLTRLQGITGESQSAQSSLAQAIERVKSVTAVPIWLGFGVSTRADLKQAHEAGATGAIVGSAFVKEIYQTSENLSSAESEAIRNDKLTKCSKQFVERLLHSGRD